MTRLALLPLLALACSMTAQLPAAIPAPIPNYAGKPAPPHIVMVVVADYALNVRDKPMGAPERYGLRNGDEVTAYLECTGDELREWVAINRDCTRWVNGKFLEEK